MRLWVRLDGRGAVCELHAGLRVVHHADYYMLPLSPLAATSSIVVGNHLETPNHEKRHTQQVLPFLWGSEASQMPMN